MYARLGVQLEVDIFDEKSPHFVAEPVGIEMTLFNVNHIQSPPVLISSAARR
jgi:hypothetical protein